MPERYDVVIVGAGFGGGILAARIAERGVNPRTGEKLRIALMDMGPYLKGDPRPGYGIPLRRQMYVNLPGEDDCRKVTPWGTIAGIGGQSLHWGANAMLPSEEDHEDWVKETGVDWTFEKLTEAGFCVDYVEDHDHRRYGAVRIGSVRLIDNVQR